MCVFVHKVICVSVCDHCLDSNNRLSVPISGGWGPGDLASPRDWLASPLREVYFGGCSMLDFFFFACN